MKEELAAVMWQKALGMLFHLHGGTNPAGFGMTELPARRGGTERGKVFMLHGWRQNAAVHPSHGQQPFCERCFGFPSTYIELNRLKPLYWVGL